MTLSDAALKEVRDAEDRDHGERALDQFVKDYEAKWPKATEKVTKDREELVAFYAFPAEHWIHLKTTNAIEGLGLIRISAIHVDRVRRGSDGRRHARPLTLPRRWLCYGSVPKRKLNTHGKS